MRFLIEVDVNAKRNTSAVLDRVIERASKGVLGDRTVKEVIVTGRIIEENAPSE